MRRQEKRALVREVAQVDLLCRLVLKCGIWGGKGAGIRIGDLMFGLGSYKKQESENINGRVKLLVNEPDFGSGKEKRMGEERGEDWWCGPQRQNEN